MDCNIPESEFLKNDSTHMPLACKRPRLALKGKYERGVTELLVDTKVGDTTLQVGSTMGFEIGRTIMINAFGNGSTDTVVIIGFSSGILVNRPLTFNHSKGETIKQLNLTAVGPRAGLTAADMVEQVGPLQAATIIVGSCAAIYIFIGFIYNRFVLRIKGSNAIPLFGGVGSMISDAKS